MDFTKNIQLLSGNSRDPGLIIGRRISQHTCSHVDSSTQRFLYACLTTQNNEVLANTDFLSGVNTDVQIRQKFVEGFLKKYVLCKHNDQRADRIPIVVAFRA